MSGWLDGIERVPNDHSGGGTYADGVPWRFVVHTVEGDPNTVSDCRLLASSHASPPHLWYSPKLQWFGQTVPLDRSAFALAHPSGTVETNKMRAIQVECFGYAADTPFWSQAWLEGLGHLIRRCINAGYPINLDRVAPTTGSDGYGTGGKVRFTETEWELFDGLCCHSNVPVNDHWDAGAINLTAVAAAARPPQPAPEPEEDDDMLYIASFPDVGVMTLVDSTSGMWVDFAFGSDVGPYQSAGVKVLGNFTDDHRTRLWQACEAIRDPQVKVTPLPPDETTRGDL